MKNVIRKYGKELPLRFTRDLSSVSGKTAAITAVKEHLKHATKTGKREQCPICGSVDFTVKAVFYECEYHECRKCMHFYCGEIFASDTFDNYYADYSCAIPNGDDFMERVEATATYRIGFAREFVEHAGGLWVDIGCGLGHTLYAAKEQGWDVFGITPSAKEHQFCQQMGLPTAKGFYSTGSYTEMISTATVVSLINVIEHVEEPVQFFDWLSREMHRGSLLLIECPRYPSLSIFASICMPQQSTRLVIPPEHLSFFSEKSIGIALEEKSGFSILGIWCYGADYFRVLTNMAYLVKKSPQNVFENIYDSLDRVQRAIDEAFLSDNMLIVAERMD